MPTPTLTSLHLVATHVLARRRFEVSGRFGLRASPGGIATPAFGEEPEVIRLAGRSLVREAGGTSASLPVKGSTLRALTAFCGSDIAAPFSCGDDTPPVGDPDAALAFDGDEWNRLAEWYSLGTRALDTVITGADAAPMSLSDPATIQLWPEHLDVGTTVTVGAGRKVNLGFSPGDGFEPNPYAYVGPWQTERRGDAAFWNAPFGAVLRASDTGTEALTACVDFLVTGLTYAAAP